MPGTDLNHWLYRYTAEEWLHAAESELARAGAAFDRKQQRMGVAGARRAAGMAWNAVLFTTGDEVGYGRSYMEHLQALAREVDVPEPVKAAARQLLDAPLATDVIPLGLLGRGDQRLARAAQTILLHARERLAAATRN